MAFWYRRKAQPKQEHPSTFPEMPAQVDYDVPTRPVAFTSDERIIYPPQTSGVIGRPRAMGDDGSQWQSSTAAIILMKTIETQLAAQQQRQ